MTEIVAELRALEEGPVRVSMLTGGMGKYFEKDIDRLQRLIRTLSGQPQGDEDAEA